MIVVASYLMANKTFTFHVHLPEGIDKVGQPIVLGNIRELGFWENPIIKLRQPFLENPTYWQSEPIAISLSNLSEKNDIKYKFAIHIPKSLFEREEKNIFEGNDDDDNRILDIERDNQFAIWKNNVIYLNKIQDYAFVDYIFNSIGAYNLKDKIMEYQHLLSLHNKLTIRASNLEYIVDRIDDKLREKRLFLCLLLGYHISRQYLNYELPKFFLSELLLDSLDNYNQETFLDTKVQMYTAIITLVQHNAFQYQFNWLRFFTIATEVDPEYTFIDRLKTLKYPNDDLLEKFIKEAEIISPYIKKIKFEIYINLAKWLIQLCHNNDALFKLWNDILLHNDTIYKSVFIDQVRKNISNVDAVFLESNFTRIPKSSRDDVAEVFRNHALFLLKSPLIKWTNPEISAIRKFLQNDNLSWHKEGIIQALELISQSNSLKLLNLFPEILDSWFHRNFSDAKEKKIPGISKNWFTLLLNKLDNSNAKFVFLVFQQLDKSYPLLSHRKNIWQNLTTIAADRVKACSGSQIIGAISFVVHIQEQEVKELFSDLIKEILGKPILQINDQLIDKVFMICNCKSKTLEVPNMMSEDILCCIMTRLQRVSSASEQHLNIIKFNKFWKIMLNATGSVEKLNANSYVQRIQMSIIELNRSLLEKTITMQLLQHLLVYSDEQLFQYFDETIGRKKSLDDAIISRDKITELRKLCNNYQIQFDMLFKFYGRFCSTVQVTDINDYIQNVKRQVQNLELKQLLVSNYWDKTLGSVKRCYKYFQSQIFQNIFEACVHEDAAATKAEYIAEKLIPIAFEKYNAMCRQLEEWEKLKCSDAFLFWKDVTNVDAELDLIEGYKADKSQKFILALDHLLKIPHWIKQLEQLEKVVKIFEVPHDENDWLSKSIRILKDDSMKLGQINNFFEYLDRNLSIVNKDCWNLIKELSGADEFMGFLKKIAEHDIRNLINGVDDHSNEGLIQEDTISSLIQVKQFLLPLMNKNKMEIITDFLDEILLVIGKNHTLGEKIALCNSSNIALQNMYNSISNRGEVAKEKIKNAVLKGAFTFTRSEKEDKCLVSLKYPSKFNAEYNLNEISDLRGQALFIAEPKNTVKISKYDTINDKDEKHIMDEFVVQVDIVQEIINVVSKLMQMGHFGYRKFEKELRETNNMKNYLKFLKEELKKWQTIVDHAQERCYYLTFFPACHILAFYDYFTSEKLDKENEEECKILIRFVNIKAQLPSRKDIKGISCGSNDYLKILCEIGNELERIFKSTPKQSRKLISSGQCVASDVVIKGKLFVAACTDKIRVPNIIMSLYANHRYYPESWQLLICTSSTTMEELVIFIKRSFFASDNGYENHLFCIANLELLDFELQYYLVNQVISMQDQEKDYLLALIYCRETGMHNHILDQISLDVHATNGLNTETMRGIYWELCQDVIRVSSDLSGQGKTEWIKEASFIKKKIPCSFLISDYMEFSRLVRQFKECKLKPIESLHINIVSSDYPEDVNMFLFELLTLGIVSTNVDIACLPSLETPTYIFIEVASTTEQHLLNSLPMARYLLFNHLTWNIKNLRISQGVNSPIQVVCHYLNLLDHNEIDTKDVLFSTEKIIKEPLPADRCQNLITKYFFDKNAEDISSFKFVEIFINVLADQLVRLSSSQFFTVDNLKLMVKETNIRTLILRTLIDVSKDFATRSIKNKAAQLESITADDENAQTIVQLDYSNYLIVFFVFFNSQTPDTISALYNDRTKVHDNIKILLKSQAIGNPENWELDDYNTMSVNTLFTKLEYLARRSTEKLDLPEYALSGDNLIKMALILLRARANIPVIVCGEAGCGKTSLIAYLAMMVEVQFQLLNLHAGIDEKIIMMFMNEALKKAEKGEIWIFFDEINTCNHIDLLADLISRRMLNGRLIHPNIRLFSACNPYRLRTRAQSETGLTTKVRKYEEQSKLVYHVKPLPDQILDYVWDYGILKPKVECKYIQIMVKKELKKLANSVFAELLFASQKFIRKVEEPYSVSLRDVKRAITLVKFFYKSFEYRPAYKKGHKYPPQSGNPTTIIRSYVLALSFCYHSRLYEQDLRKQYRREMGQILQNHRVYVGENMFAKIIREEQEDYINRMQCPPNTAMNEALLENVLVMIVCILTRIPLFLIGTTGSSKSLAIRLISSNLRGSDSNDKYFRSLPQIYLIPYQGSSSSTSNGIIKVFEKANRYQETTSKQFPILSVVLLDNIGLAEINPFNPLKVLHSLLEPSYPATGPTVSVIGISNWRLDISKSSRALLVQRPQFALDDLVDTAERLLNKKVILYGQRGAIEPLAKAYSDYEKHDQFHPNFHGLRDYYSLVKWLSLNEMTPENLQMALARNFGGTENNAKLCEKYFGNVLKMFNNHNPWFYEPIPTEQLINSNLDDSDARHLMIIGKSDSIVNLLTYRLRRKNLDPVVILGSQFPDDQDDYSYSVLSRIMMCIEAGRPLILTDLEIIYGSLYDLWNQNYIVVGSKDNAKYFTSIVHGAYTNPMLYVAPSFKCILVVDEKNLASADPSLLNRFEKQKMSINDILNDKHKLFVENLTNWATQMSTLVGVDQITQLRNKFTQKDLFIGFDEDETLQSLVFDITKNDPEAEDYEILEKCKECLIAIASSDGVIRAERSALEREEANQWKRVYIHQQHHDSLYDYFADLFNQEKLLTNSKGHLVIINTFSNINTDVRSCLQGFVKCQVDKLSTFRNEVQLSNWAKHFWLESTDHMLILQCDITAVNAGCIKLAKFIIEQFRNEFIARKDQMEQKPMKHACIILHTDRNQESALVSFNFMCGWKQFTIESLDRQKIPLHNLLDKSLYDIINSEQFKKIVSSTMPFEKLLKDELLWCLSCIKYQLSNDSYNIHIRTLYKEILSDANFIQCIKTKTFEWIFKNCKDWQSEVARNRDSLNQFRYFSLALQNYAKITIKQTIAKILYLLEKISVTITFFNIGNNERSAELYDLWKKYLMDNTIIDINMLPEPKPSGYMMQCTIVNELKFPFSYYFTNQINYYRNYYEEELDILSQDSENINKNTKKLQEELVEDHIEDFRNNLLSINPIFETLQKYSELYYNDFIKIISSSYTTKKFDNKKELDFIFRHLIGDKIVFDPFLLHIYWWKYADKILIQLQLVENFPDIITKVQEDFIVYGTLDQYLFKEAINLVLQKICDNDEWEQMMDIILSLGNKINITKNLLNISLLLICSDLLSINSIPLEKIKEMIYLGKSIKNQEFITIDIVKLVFDNLDYDENLAHIRSFIIRSLKLIPVESEIRLIIYKNLFSRKPFQLVNVVIEKIFTTEYQQNEQIFFILIKNPEEALQLSKRLMTINNNLNIKEDSDINMAELCCEMLQNIFTRFDLKELLPYFKHSIEAFTKQEGLALQQMTSIALIKEFIYKFWKNYIKDDSLSKLLLVKEINDCMNINQLFKSYFLFDLRAQQKTIDDIKQLNTLKNDFPCIENNNEVINFLPKLWRSTRKVNFRDFYTFYNGNITQNLDKFPFLSVYFDHYETLKLIKYLHPIVRFVKILNSKAEYNLSKKLAQTMTFNEFIKKESIEDIENGIYLKSLFEEFALGWNSVINYIVQYRCKDLPLNKPFMNLELPVIFGLIEQSDTGIYICAILDFLIKLHNDFLDNVFAIPVGKCKSLKFLEDSSLYDQTPKAYFFKSIKVIQAQDFNFIIYDWNEKILKHSQKVGQNNFMFDLQQIEMKLVKKLVLNKVYFEKENNQFYFKDFPFKHEIFHNSPRILFDIKEILPQEPVPIDKMLLILTVFQPSNSSLILENSLNSINLHELLFLFEIILIHIKELSISNSNILIIDFVDQWLKLARYNITLIDIFKEFSLKYVIGLYELIEEQVANLIIHNIDDKFKIPLTQEMKDSINNVINYDQENQNQQLIPAKTFALALKRFINRYLLVDFDKENSNLNIFFMDFSLELWTTDIKEEMAEKFYELIPTCLLVSHAYYCYIFIVDEIEKAKKENTFTSTSSTSSSTSGTRKTRIKKFKKI